MKGEMYDESFYSPDQRTEYAASKVLGIVFGLHPVRSIVDVGCGRGAWLGAAARLGACRLVGIDGLWNRQELMLDQRISFVGHDLETSIRLDEGFDLCISMEVAEHLAAESAECFVASLCSLSDVIVFGAAFVGQGGTGHVNENRHSYWGRKFRGNGYKIFDLIRPQLWGDESMQFWYRQNTFLYVSEVSPLARSLSIMGVRELDELDFMDAVHPELYDIYRANQMSFGDVMRAVPGALRRTVRARMRAMLDPFTG